MANKQPRSRDARYIADAYYRAKTANPRLTQGEFARKSFPTIAERYANARNGAERKRIEQSGARYLRLVLEGKRTGAVNVKRGTRSKGFPDLFQVFVPVQGGGWKSFDLGAAGARSTFDIPLVEQRLRENSAPLEARARIWAQRYALAQSELRIDNFEVRRVTKHRRHAEYIDLRLSDTDELGDDRDDDGQNDYYDFNDAYDE